MAALSYADALRIVYESLDPFVDGLPGADDPVEAGEDIQIGQAIERLVEQDDADDTSVVDTIVRTVVEKARERGSDVVFAPSDLARGDLDTPGKLAQYLVDGSS